MIRGYILGGRPFVAGLVVVPAADPAGNPFRATVRFLVDTGADVTMLSPVDYEGRLGLALAVAPAGPLSQGVVGATATRLASGFLGLLHEDGGLSGFPLTFILPEVAPGQRALEFSLLGRDVLSQGSLSMDFPLVAGFCWISPRCPSTALVCRASEFTTFDTRLPPLLLERGVHPKMVQELLGHSTITLTLDT